MRTPMRSAPRWLTGGALALGLALSGCHAKKDDKSAQAAGDELLPRSASDDMLPYDTVTSQPELLDPAAAARSARTAPAQVQQDAEEEADTPDDADDTADQTQDNSTTAQSGDDAAPASPAPGAGQ